MSIIPGFFDVAVLIFESGLLTCTIFGFFGGFFTPIVFMTLIFIYLQYQDMGRTNMVEK